MSRPSLLKSRSFQILIGLAVTVACLAWALWMVKSGRPWADVFHEIATAFEQADYRTLVFMWVILAVFYWIKAYRWRLLLKPVGDFDATLDLLPPLMAGFAGNNIFPLRLGELIRVVLFSRTHRVPMSTSLATVAVERILDALTILVLLAIGVSQLDYVDPDVSTTLKTGGVLFSAVAACIVVYLIWTQPFLRFAAWCVAHVPLVPARFGQKALGMLETGSVGLVALKRGGLLGGIVLTSIAQWLLNALYIACAVWAFRIQLPWEGALVLMGVVAFGVAVPSVPGFFGVMQFWFVVVLKMYPISPDRIFAASIYYQLSQFVPVTLIGVLYISRLGFRMADVQPGAPAEPIPSPPPPGAASN
ncbi:MAG: flippase-like domain-containing protein [Planctomycetaceae bacterium]|nr:flippase-like domain-containing protein [Planctomycetaceae bacterium]